MEKNLPYAFLRCLFAAKAIMIFCFLFFVSPHVFSQTTQASVQTDQLDYAPGSTVYITGSGFTANETVTLQILHYGTVGDNLTVAAHQPWTVAADASGNISSTWVVPIDDDELGATLQLTAVGVSSGLTAQEIFTDAANTKMAITAVPAITGGAIAYGGTVKLIATLTQTSGGAAVSNEPITFTFNGTAQSQTATTDGTGTAFIIVNLTTTGTSGSRINANTVVPVSATFGGDINFKTSTSPASNFTVATAFLTLSNAAATSKAYDGTNTAAITGTLNGVFSGDVVTLTGTGTFASLSVANSIAVTSTSTLGGAQQANYSLTQPTSLTANITPKALTLTNPAATGKFYDGTATAVVTGTLTGVLTADVPNVILNATGTFATPNVGNNIAVTSTSTLSGTAAGNYTLTQPTGLTASITVKALTITGVSAVNKMYDGTTTASLTGTPALSGVLTADISNVTLGGTPSATFSTVAVGTGKPVTVTGYSISGSASTNYSLTQPIGLTANITAKVLAITGITAVNKTYDGTISATLTGTALLSGAISGDVVTLGGTPSAVFSDALVGTSKQLTVSGYTISGAASGNYTLTQPIGLTANISAKALTITGVSAVNKIYDGTTSATLTGTALLSGVISGDVVTLGGTPSAVFFDALIGIGKPVTVLGYTISGAASGNYSLTQPTGLTANISAKSLTITGISVINKTYDGNNTASLTGTAVLNGVVTADAFNLTLGGTPSAVFSTASVATGKPVTVSGYSINGTASGNYSLTQPTGLTANITPKALTITGITANNKTYDKTTIATLAGTAVLNGVLAADVSNVTLGGTPSATFSDVLVGTGKPVMVTGYSISGTVSGNYSLTQPTGLTANITAKPITVTGITANNKTYDGTTTATLTGTAALSGVMGSDNSGVTLNGTPLAVFPDALIGNSKIVTVNGYSINGSASGNYTLTQPTLLTANINPATLTITANSVTKTYGTALTGGAGSAAFTPTGLQNGETISSVTITYGTGAATNASVALSPYNGSLTPSLATGGTFTASNYTISYVSGNIIVNKAPLTVTATGGNKIYDGTTSALITLGDNRISGDVFTEAYTTAIFTDNKNAGNNKPVSVSGISINGGVSGNYTLGNTTANTTASISQKALTVTAAGIDRAYDGTTAATVNLSDNKISSDNILDAYTSASFADKNAGNNKPVSVTGITISGTDAVNYSFNTAASTTASITQAQLTITASGGTKVYDGKTTASAMTLGDNRVSGDVLTDAYTAAAFADKNVATGKTVTTSGITVTGTDAANYIYNATATSLADITQAQLTITASGGTKVYGGKTTASAMTLGDNRVSGDALTDAYASADFSDKNAGTGKTVTTTGITITGADAGNYSYNTSATSLADITQALLTITASGGTKVYDGKTTASAMTLGDNRVSGDVLTDAYASADFSDKN
ncbi:MAG: C-terminal target protein, partial [Mucilaginibacter sp.]|nr:C-terminal target protein [Mucilaginibacter sp.]